jgi:hypothetical protein
MAMVTLFETQYTAEFMVSEANGHRSRMTGVVQNPGSIDVLMNAGLVLTTGVEGTPTAVAGAANHGNGTIGALSASGPAETGTYLLTATGATEFSVQAPNGTELAPAMVGTAYTEGGLGFLIAAGATAFAAGDSFTITVPPPAPSFGQPQVTPGANTGTGEVLQIGPGTGEQFGNYVLTATGATNFSVKDPHGNALPAATVGTPYAGQVDFLISAGETPFVAGDSFTITVPSGMPIYSALTAASPGPAAGVLFDTQWVPAQGQSTVTVIVREAEVNGGELKWDSSMSPPLIAAAEQQLAALGIIVR